MIERFASVAPGGEHGKSRITLFGIRDGRVHRLAWAIRPLCMRNALYELILLENCLVLVDKFLKMTYNRTYV